MKRSFPVQNLRVNRVAKSYAASVAATETYVSTRKPTRMVTDPFLHPSMELHVGSLIGGKKLFGCADDEMMLRSLHLFPPAGNESFNLQAWISGELQELAPSVEIVANIRNWHPTLENWARLEPELRLAIQASRNSRGLAVGNRAARMNAADGEVVGASQKERISGLRLVTSRRVRQRLLQEDDEDEEEEKEELVQEEEKEEVGQEEEKGPPAPAPAPMNITLNMSSAMFNTDLLTCPACKKILPDDFAQSACGHIHCRMCLRASEWACTLCGKTDPDPKATPLIAELLRAYPRKASCGKTYYSSASSHRASCFPCFREEALITFRESVTALNGPNRARAIDDMTKLLTNTIDSRGAAYAVLERERKNHDKTSEVFRTCITKWENDYALLRGINLSLQHEETLAQTRGRVRQRRQQEEEKGELLQEEEDVAHAPAPAPVPLTPLPLIERKTLSPPPRLCKGTGINCTCITRIPNPSHHPCKCIACHCNEIICACTCNELSCNCLGARTGGDKRRKCTCICRCRCMLGSNVCICGRVFGICSCICTCICTCQYTRMYRSSWSSGQCKDPGINCTCSYNESIARCRRFCCTCGKFSCICSKCTCPSEPSDHLVHQVYIWLTKP